MNICDNGQFKVRLHETKTYHLRLSLPDMRLIVDLY